MAALNTSLKLQSNHVIYPDALHKIFAVDAGSSLQLAPRPLRPVKIAVIGNHLPRQCGIATFTTDLCDAISAVYGAAQLSVVAVNDGQSSYTYPERVRFEIREGDLSSYRAAADFLNASDVDLVCLQHEFGIFGGKSGSYIVDLLKNLQMPVITTLHTVLREPNLDQRVIMRKISARSKRLIVMSQYSSRVLQEVFNVPAEKIELIPHGIPDLPFEESNLYKNRFSCQGKCRAFIQCRPVACRSRSSTHNWAIAICVELEKTEREDLERYIDVTRGELFFSKGVILVEGDAERFLLPTLAKLHDPDMDFDALGISVCSIAGTNFGPYVQLLGPDGLDIPFVVLTDFDPKGEPGIQEDADPEADIGKSYGNSRVVNQIMIRLFDAMEWDKLSIDDVLKEAPNLGIFLNDYTFEIDLFRGGAEDEFAQAMKGLTDNKAMHKRFDNLSKHPEALDPHQFLKDIDSVGKGRFAQRLASLLLAAGNDVCKRSFFPRVYSHAPSG